MRRVGLDLALKAPHRAAVFEDATPVGKAFKVDRSKAGMDELERRARLGANPDARCEFIMEPTGLAWLPLAAELVRRGHSAFVPKPQKTHALRKFYSQFAKTDAVDAQAQALVRHVDPKGVHALHVPTAAETTLRLTVKQRARLVVEASRAKGRIQAWLVLANPQLAEAFEGALFGQAGTAFLRRYVDPFRVRAMGKSELARFLKRHTKGAADAERAEAIWRACASACEQLDDLRAANMLPFEYVVLQSLVSQELERIEHLEQQASALETVIRDAYLKVDPERVLEREVPGVGPTIAPTIEAFCGDVERFSSGKRFAAFFGLVPRTNQTGGNEGKPRQRLTKGGPALLKQYLFLAGETARRADPELAAAYDGAIARGKHHYAAVIIVAHKLLRKIFALLKLRAQWRRARAGGQPGPVVEYRYLDPQTGEVLTASEARALVQTRHPTKAAKAKAASARAKKRAVEAAPQPKGSSKDVTNVVEAPPPAALLPESAACAKTGAQAVSNQPESRVNFALDVT